MLSVIINHYKSQVALKLCLKSVGGALKNLKHEIIVTDSQAEKETETLIKENFPEVDYIAFKKNVGFAKLVNAGIKKAEGEYLFMLNADNILIEKTAEKLINFLKQHDDVGLVGPKLEYQNGKHQPSAFRFYTPFIILARRTFVKKLKAGKRALNNFTLKDLISEPLEKMPPLEVDWLMGSALLAKKKAIEKVGLFDERFFMYFEDVDWCRRFWAHGWKVVWLPEVKIIHVHAQASKKRGAFYDIILNPYARIHLKSAWLYFLKHGFQTPLSHARIFFPQTRF